ncbi:acyl-CoA dehydrogenase family protein [Ilumatobacter sp.]|uniref:acyl-CoA dehydrogenase family protein n=1 Tax=Ilumatobacter sp. TaxID=1967498 RepID=UPI003753D9C1
MSDKEVAFIHKTVKQLLEVSDPRSVSETAFRGAVYDAGLAWVSFPEHLGGLGLPASHQPTIDSLLAAAGASELPREQFLGTALAGPTIASHGSEDLQQRTLRRIYTGEDLWCQLFSEPAAGSDLAAVAALAVRDGDEWVVSGQKVWNTMAHLSDKGMLVARTNPDAPKHKGLTYFMVDMHASGIEVRPLRQVTGEAEFNEVFLDEVRIPDADRIGDVGEGWKVAMTTLMNERTSVGGGGASGIRQAGTGPIAEALRVWDDLPHEERRSELRNRLSDLWIRAEALRLTDLRASSGREGQEPGPESSISKLMLGQSNQAIYEFCVDALGANGQIDFDYTLRRAEGIGLEGPPGSGRQMFLRSRANSIEGGTSEIMKNIIGERVLGLPGEPRVDRDIPWREANRLGS